ncbi:hypothetical protein EK21DRAFT_86263 [Setomelanomma holmii]|uniref:Uncharacterized protein n=1 Tax=Setomelanomma holmii TaxID=210430 RepID=A0A9P4LR74_9PLEO|nr:hypothetical protein EK21DRAFT_86263 [Setomelanomma holmii]
MAPRTSNTSVNADNTLKTDLQRQRDKYGFKISKQWLPRGQRPHRNPRVIHTNNPLRTFQSIIHQSFMHTPIFLRWIPSHIAPHVDGHNANDCVTCQYQQLARTYWGAAGANNPIDDTDPNIARLHQLAVGMTGSTPAEFYDFATVFMRYIGSLPGTGGLYDAWAARNSWEAHWNEEWRALFQLDYEEETLCMPCGLITVTNQSASMLNVAYDPAMLATGDLDTILTQTFFMTAGHAPCANCPGTTHHIFRRRITAAPQILRICVDINSPPGPIPHAQLGQTTKQLDPWNVPDQLHLRFRQLNHSLPLTYTLSSAIAHGGNGGRMESGGIVVLPDGEEVEDEDDENLNEDDEEDNEGEAEEEEHLDNVGDEEIDEAFKWQGSEDSMRDDDSITSGSPVDPTEPTYRPKNPSPREYIPKTAEEIAAEVDRGFARRLGPARGPTVPRYRGPITSSDMEEKEDQQMLDDILGQGEDPVQHDAENNGGNGEHDEDVEINASDDSGSSIAPAELEGRIAGMDDSEAKPIIFRALNHASGRMIREGRQLPAPVEEEQQEVSDAPARARDEPERICRSRSPSLSNNRPRRNIFGGLRGLAMVTEERFIEELGPGAGDVPHNSESSPDGDGNDDADALHRRQSIAAPQQSHQHIGPSKQVAANVDSSPFSRYLNEFWTLVGLKQKSSASQNATSNQGSSANANQDPTAVDPTVPNNGWVKVPKSSRKSSNRPTIDVGDSQWRVAGQPHSGQTHIINVRGPDNESHVESSDQEQLGPGQLQANPQRPGHGCYRPAGYQVIVLTYARDPLRGKWGKLERDIPEF